MTKSDLAIKLRQLLKAGLIDDDDFRLQLKLPDIVPERVLEWAETADDDAIIDTYLECPDCSSRIAEGAELKRLIAESQCEQDFFARCQAVADGRSCRFYWPAEIKAKEVI
jgi:hypothetical protein